MKSLFVKKTMFFIASLFLLISILPGCMTCTRGTNQSVTISSEPPGASIVKMGATVGTTPAILELARKRNHAFILRKEGYQEESVMITRTADAGLAGNILLGGIIGGIVDAASGSMYKLVPKEIYVKLTPLKSGETAKAIEEIDENIFDAEKQFANLKKLLEQGQITDEEYKATRIIYLKQALQEKQITQDDVKELLDKQIITAEEYNKIKK